jgi:1-acyl-sn-glycerol-3-phosphate acyltransferase
MLLAVLKIGMDVHWLGKSSLFAFPFARLMRWLGGIPVDRSKNNNLVDQLIDLYRQRDELVLIIPPEGTRAQVERWKSGFYYVAQGAGAPILLGFIDSSRKQLGFGPLFYQPVITPSICRPFRLFTATSRACGLPRNEVNSMILIASRGARPLINIVAARRAEFDRRDYVKQLYLRLAQTLK